MLEPFGAIQSHHEFRKYIPRAIVQGSKNSCCRAHKTEQSPQASLDDLETIGLSWEHRVLDDLLVSGYGLALLAGALQTWLLFGWDFAENFC